MKKLFLALLLAAAPVCSQQAFSDEVCVEEEQVQQEGSEKEVAQSEENN